MPTIATFDEVLDAVEHLPAEQQADLIDVVRRRLAEKGRRQVIADAADAKAELAAGTLTPKSVAEIMREIEE